MIVYSFLEEIRIVIYLIAYSITIFAFYDFFVNSYKGKMFIKLLLQTIYSLIWIYITYQFVFKLQKGYIPGYFFLIIIIGAYIYFKLIRKSFLKIIKYNMLSLKKIKEIIRKLFKPLKIFKRTILEIKFKKNTNNNQNALQK